VHFFLVAYCGKGSQYASGEKSTQSRGRHSMVHGPYVDDTYWLQEDNHLGVWLVMYKNATCFRGTFAECVAYCGIHPYVW
jgi:hypothetical protein